MPSQIDVSTAPTSGNFVRLSANAAVAGVWNTTGIGDDTVITINNNASSTSGKKGTSVGTPVIDFSNLTFTGNLGGLAILEIDANGWENVNFNIGNIMLEGSGAMIQGLVIQAAKAASWTIGAIDIESNNNATGIVAGNNFDSNLTITNAVNVYSANGIARGVDFQAAGGMLSVNAPVVAVTGSGSAVAINAPNSTVVLGANAAAVTSGDSTGIAVQARNLTLANGFNNLGNKFTALITQSSGVVNLGAINLTGLTNSKITASQFVLTGNANIADVVIDGDGYAVAIDLQGHNLTATSDFIGIGANNLTIIKDTSGGSGIAELMKLTGNINITDKATVKIDGSNFTNSDTITLDGTNAVLVVGGGGAGTKEFDGNVAATATAQLAALNGADITDSGIQVKSASGTYEWGAVKDANSINDWYIAVIGINSLSTNSNATEVAHLFHNKYTVWHAVQDHLISGASRSGSGYLGQSPCGKVTSYAPCGSILGTAARTAWVNYVGRSNSYFDTAFQSNWKIGTDGVQVGSDLYRTKKTQFGVLFGYEGGKATVLSDAVESDDVYAGFYGVHVFGNGSDARLIFNKGWQDFDLSRSAGAATAAFKGETTEVTLEWGRRFSRYGWSFRPAAAFDYFGSDTDGFTEAGSGDVYAKSYFSQTFFRFGSDLRYEAGRFALNSGLYYSYDLHGDTLATSLNGITNASLGSDLGRSVLTFRVGGSYLVGKSFTVFGGYQGEALLDADKNSVQHIGHIGGVWKW